MRKATEQLSRIAAVLAAGLAFGAYSALADKKPDVVGLGERTIEVRAEAITAFERERSEAKQFGKLEFRGGLVLTSPNPNFGGWSALALDAQGRRLLAISDTGVWLAGELTYEGETPSGIANARLGPLLDFNGKPFQRLRDRDSEGLAVVSGTVIGGEALISFEINDRILKYPIGEAGVGVPTGTIELPPETKRLIPNKGLESVCHLKAGPNAGAIVTLAERFPTPPAEHAGWLSDGKGRWQRLAITSIDDFYLTDCHGLPDGGMLVLERRFRWSDILDGVRMRLRRFTAEEIASGQPMSGEILIAASKENEIDNMEGLATHQGANGETIITMISDDNFNAVMQRTVLLQFALPAPDKVSAKK